jgi:hypothetical protein
VSIGMGTFEGLLHAMGESERLEEAVSRLLEAIVPLLGLSRASLESIEERGGVRCLAPLAVAGEHAALARDMPSRLLSSSVDSAEAVATRSPVLVGDLHGIGELAETDSSVARWRAGMSAQAYAVLPLLWRERDEVIGVLTVEWSTPHEFDVQERDALMWMAASLGSAIASFRGERTASPHAAPASPTGRQGTPGLMSVSQAAPGLPISAGEASAVPRVIGLSFDAQGGIRFAGSPDAAAPEALSVTFSVADASDDRSAPLWDVIALGKGQAVLLSGVVQAPAGRASLLAERARQMVRSAVLSGVDLPASVGTLGLWARMTAQAGSRVSAGLASIDVRTGEVQAALGGGVRLDLLGRDGRSTVRTGPGGSSAGSTDEVSTWRFLGLEGDELALTVDLVKATARVLRIA